MLANSSVCPVGLLAWLTPPHNLNTTALEHDALANLAASPVLEACALTASLFALLLGARLLKPSLFLAAFATAWVASAIAVEAVLTAAPALSPTTACLAVAIAPTVIGLMAGATAICCLDLGFALLGAAAGAGLGYTLYAAGLDAIPQPLASIDLVLVLSLSIGAVLGAAVLFRYQKPLLIAATACLGAAGATPAMAMLLAHAGAPAFLHALRPHDPNGWAPPLVTLVLLAGEEGRREGGRGEKRETLARWTCE